MAEIKIPVTITLRERDLLLNETTAVDEDVLAKIRVAEVVGNKIRFSISPDDLDHLLDNMAFEANHAVSAKIESAFESIYHRMEKIDDAWCKKENEQTLITNPPSEGVVEVHRSEVNENLARLMNQQFFGFARKPMSAYFDAPIQALGGLTPKQMQGLFRDGWWGKEPLIRLNTELGLDDFAASRFLKNARTFLQVLQDVGSAPLTVKGNLARKFVGEMLERMEMDDDYKKEILQYNKVVNEDDLCQSLRLMCVLLDHFPVPTFTFHPFLALRIPERPIAFPFPIFYFALFLFKAVLMPSSPVAIGYTILVFTFLLLLSVIVPPSPEAFLLSVLVFTL